MSIQKAQGRSVSGGGKVAAAMQGTFEVANMTPGPTKTSMRRDTDPGRDSEGAQHTAARGQSFGGAAGGTSVQIKKG